MQCTPTPRPTAQLHCSLGSKRLTPTQQRATRHRQTTARNPLALMHVTNFSVSNAHTVFCSYTVENKDSKYFLLYFSAYNYYALGVWWLE